MPEKLTRLVGRLQRIQITLFVYLSGGKTGR